MLMNMENENVQHPTYEELGAAYQQLAAQAQEVERRYQALLQDKMLEKIKVICGIVEHKEAYSAKVQKLADWHLQQMLAKPRN
jgi:hypothetical protein